MHIGCGGILQLMKIFRRKWQDFFDSSIRRMISSADTSILDIGGGLRLTKERSNRVDHRNAWITEAMEKKQIKYRILDYVDTYHPDIVGDIQKLPLADNSEEAIVCMSILEHVENPFLASSEMHRVLKPGGTLLIYVPFLFYYHAENGYYADYWRFTEEALRTLCKDFSSVEIHPSRGAFETWIKLSPIGRYQFMCDLGCVLDKILKKEYSKQTSGYYVFAVK